MSSRQAAFSLLHIIKLPSGKEKDYAFRRQLDEKPGIIPGCPGIASWIDWISATLSKGHTDLRSLVKCMDHRETIAWQS